MRATEFLSAVTTPATDLEPEQYSHIDIRRHNAEIIQARKDIKRARRSRDEQPLFALLKELDNV